MKLNAADAASLITSPEVPKTATGEDPEAIRKAARGFEAVFFHQIMKTMRASVPEGGAMAPGFGGSVFTDMLDQEYSQLASESGQLGLADIMAEQLGAKAIDETATPKVNAPKPAHLTQQITRAYGRQGGGDLVIPTEGRVSSLFGARTLNGVTRDHTGLDIAAPTGTPIYAALPGVVLHAGPRGTYGNTVIVDHANGVQTRYSHASEVLVKPGQVVQAGEVVAEVGSTGGSTGPHLHFEVRRYGEPEDPARLLKLGTVEIGTRVRR